MSRKATGPIAPEALESVRAEVLRAIKDSRNDTLCCGVIGCLEAIFMWDQTFVREATPQLIERFVNSGMQVDARNFGLFQGQGGVAYFAARLLAPDRVPNVCLLQVPKI